MFEFVAVLQAVAASQAPVEAQVSAAALVEAALIEQHLVPDGHVAVQVVQQASALLVAVAVEAQQRVARAFAAELVRSFPAIQPARVDEMILLFPGSVLEYGYQPAQLLQEAS